ncbi:MAG: UDP-N-acetylmuramoyl-tripeptide--D-alanyl-D-alanine ligase [Chiayiivirga sp.]|jgi:UDP-N-acetylmuramoyl-tripeptide--D-alanyl-D-alanine ligase|uniref:UDP-N-acetylmuramoyl-tripeptide--D-alanyl-D- alanine ligase n=1 Tax=Chiayiivirga sp. TaxID=2041042 RepID=UPI0025C131DE|nr:UDP-N-acetylmuramoyl-tripeptide--D-alanyl-D-alanine ligase [Chiayiivirga sp.]MCI1728502.1 UDP-N-acetylmuramoyl-tripeptide--D-alanyl-D-alanine ligase [Chiayiivirga sp.]
MRPFALTEAAAWCGAALRGADQSVRTVATDTRQPMPGALFVALRGETFDAHDFVARAAEQGAVALLVSRPVTSTLPQLVCVDTQIALGALARGLAATRSTRLIGLTGSNGKTTVKTLTQSILSRVGVSYANPGNRNNEVGLPLAVIDQPEGAQFGIYEMGAGQPGDIAYLADIARPDIALVNNVASAHLERMGSLLGVAETKGAIYQALPDDGIAVINADEAFAPLFAQYAGARRLLRFGLEGSADVRALKIELGAERTRFVLSAPLGEIAVELALGGRHNLMNALAAASLALAADAPLQAIADGLAAAERVPGRQTPHRLRNGALLIDDSYNANPGSVRAALATLTLGGGEAWLVLGDMRELGVGERHLHAEIGDAARDAGIRRFFTVGELSESASRAFGLGARHYASQAELIEALRHELVGLPQAAEVRCLVKGSRGSRMDRVVAALLADSREASHAA